jgi:hypothetical protein
MKTYKKVEIIQVTAAQYGKDEEAKELVRLCRIDYDGDINPLPRDLMGTPKDAFKGVETADGWRKIEKGDWIIKKENEILVVSNDVFKLMFEEV